MTESPGLARLFQAGDRIQLRVTSPDGGDPRRCKSVIQDVTPEGILVAMPVDRRMPVPEGGLVIVSMWKGFADHVFESRIIKSLGGRARQLLLAAPKPEDITRTPRREHFRVDTEIATRVGAVSDRHQRITLLATMVDLSARGCRLQVSQSLAPDSPLTLDFDLPFPPDEKGLDRSRPMRQVSGTIRSSYSPSVSQRPSGAKQAIWMLGIVFDRLDSVVHNSLLRYVAFRQRQLLDHLKDADPAGGRPTAPNLERLEQRLSQLEEELEEAGQAVPPTAAAGSPGASADAQAPPALDAATGAPADPDAPAPPGANPDLESVDSLFSPPAAPAAPGPRPPEALPPIGAASGRTILLVEDEQTLRGVVAEALQHQGHSVFEAANGQEALEIATESRVDLVLTDLMMPRMNGWRLLSSLRERHLDVPIIIITGYMGDEGQEVLTSRDIAGFLVKPIDLEDMVRMVASVMAPTAPRAKPRILAVDDEETTRLTVGTWLEHAGFLVEIAVDGQDALDKVDSFGPDLLVLDLTMPRLDGFETCRRLRARPETADLPVIMITAKSSAEHVRQAVRLKINGYVIKSFDAETLIAHVRKALQAVGKA